MNQCMNTEVVKHLMDAVDWNRPDLAGSHSDVKAGAASFVAYMRGRQTPLTGFWEAGLLFPEFKGFAKFAALAPGYFEDEMQLLMYPDGFSRERSGYHWGTVQHFLEFLMLAEANHIRFSPRFRDHVRRMGDTLWQMMAPDGDIPRFGDTGSIHEPGKGVARLMMAAALLRLPEGKAVAEVLMPDLDAPLPALKPGDHGETAAWQDRVSIHGLLPAAGRNLFADYLALGQKLPPVDSGLLIESDGQTDYYLDLHVHWNLPWSIGPCRGSQRLFHSRIHGIEPTYERSP